MAQTGYTPISLYYSTTAAAAPTAGNLVAGELALNTQDEKLYFKNAAGTVKLLASSAGALGSVTSVAQTFTGGLISVSGSPITSSGTLALTVAGTSGGIPYFSSASTWATSAALAANALVIGGGAGAAPSTTTTGTGVLTALGVNTGSAGAFVVNGGALGTPSSGTVTNLTGTASININGTVGATTPSTGAFTTLSATGQVNATGGAIRVFGALDAGQISASVIDWQAVTESSRFLSYGSSGVAGNFSWTSVIGGGAGTVLMNLTSSGNLGLGVTPSAWSSAYRVVELGAAGNTLVSFNPSDMGLTSAVYYNAGWKHAVSGSNGAAFYEQDNGNHLWSSVLPTSHTAGDAATMAERMRIDSSGNVGIGTSSAVYGGQLNVKASSVTALSLQNSNFSAATSGTQFNTFFGSATGSTYAAMQVNSGGGLSYGDLVLQPNGGNLGLGVTPSTSNAGRTFELNTVGNQVRCNGINDMNVESNTYYNSGFKYASTGTATRYAQSSGQHQWHTAASGTAGNAISFTQAMTLDASGNLGIGATSPGSRLQVTGANVTFDTAVYGQMLVQSSTAYNATPRAGVVFSVKYTSGGAYTAGGCSIQSYKENATDGDFGTGLLFTTQANALAPAERMRIDSSGNVGIGTTAGTTTVSSGLAINNATAGNYPGLEIQTAGVTRFYINANNAASYISSQSTNPMVFQTNGSERMRIDSSGNLLVGTTSAYASAKVSINSAAATPALSAFVTASNLGAAGIFSKFDNDNTTSNIFLQFLINNGAAGSGQINANGASQAAFGSYSDARLKENIEPLHDQLSAICALRPVEFDYKYGGGHQIGFIAQELQQVYPDSIGVGANDMLTVTGWGKTESRLVKAIQEQQAIIESLAARIAALEAQ